MTAFLFRCIIQKKKTMYSITMDSFPIPPTRKVYIDPNQSSLLHKTKKRKLCQTTSSNGNEETESSTASLAHAFVDLTNQNPKNSKRNLTTNLIKLAQQICISKRSLQFSNTDFVNIWLDQLLTGKTTIISSSSPLLIYHALTRHTNYLTLGTLVIRAELRWLEDQCEQLLSISTNVYRGTKKNKNN
ncbi:hypothetical protein BDA99DRAFT_89892 [Phascolomyces articulosus]|uniref:Uncharacterized protein n=1 Tax=Phascolomyces articulosus TaxID=60185 RepID=A0AAD5K8N4_9FUNG|nr:hypothetical protein BDA99DRAFT_89892 [Phascolomyces articulosus]